MYRPVFQRDWSLLTSAATHRGLFLLLALGLLCAGSRVDGATNPSVVPQPSSAGPGRFAAEEIQRACRERGPVPGLQTITLEATGDGVPQSYRIERASASDVRVIGADPAGAMYGGLEVAEAIRLGTLDTLPKTTHSPYVARRGLKFNLPLDLRTPSYSDCGDSFQANIPEVWSMEFWREFLNEMARNRYNVLTLWSLHPFPSLVKVPEYPEVALDDVWRTTLKLDDTFSHSGSDMVRPAMLEQHEVVKRLTIEQKMQFWREVMQLAKDRGVEVYLFTWNMFVFGAEGKHGITKSQTNRVTMDYFRKSVRETLLAYPLLAGMGVTAGERMEERRDEFAKETWLWQTYGQGIRDALQQQPGRQFRLIHRYHQTGQGEVLRQWQDYPGPFEFSFKYAIAHMYSITNPPFIKEVLPSLPADKRTWLTVRNDDIYSFRWGDPQYARDFIRNLPGPDKLAGFYMGPDGYCWGREFIDREPQTPRQLVMQKQWYSFMLWGRLSYDPTLPDSFFERVLARHFPEVPADKLLRAWAAASKVFPQITRFFWGDIDVRWFPEACLSHPRVKGFYTVRHFMEGSTMPGSGCLNIRAWREAVLKDGPTNGVTPLQVAANLQSYANETLRLVGELRSQARLPSAPATGSIGASPGKELRLTLGDLEAFAHTGNYYAQKILAAADLALFDATRKPEQKAAAIRHLETALEDWKRYAAVATSQYKPQLLNRVGYVDLADLTGKVERDIVIAREWQPGTIQESGRKAAGVDRPFVP